MSLQAWLATGALRTHKPSRKEIAGLLALADRSLADAGIGGLSAEGRFQFAYNAALTMASAALHAAGYRTNSNAPGHHAITVESAEHRAQRELGLVHGLRIGHRPEHVDRRLVPAPSRAGCCPARPARQAGARGIGGGRCRQGLR